MKYSQTTMFSSTAARMVFLEVEVDYFMSLLKTLHWLSISLRIKSKNLTVALQNVTTFNRPHFPTAAALASLLFLEHSKHGPSSGPWYLLFSLSKASFPQMSRDSIPHAIQVLPRYHFLRVAFLSLWYETALRHPPVTVLRLSPPHISYM